VRPGTHASARPRHGHDLTTETAPRILPGPSLTPSTTGGEASGGPWWNIRGGGRPASRVVVMTISLCVIFILPVFYLYVRKVGHVGGPETSSPPVPFPPGGESTGSVPPPLSPKGEAPKEEAPKEEAPKEEAPKEEAPKEEAPKEEAPKEEAPRPVPPPKEEAPKEEAPKEEAPKEEAPKEEAPRPVPPPQKPAILAGYIIDAETREPLAGVTLTIQDWETIDGQSPTATTDAAGRFRFDNLRPSADVSQQVRQVRLIARKPGYKAYTTDTPLGSTTLPIKLRPATQRIRRGPFALVTVNHASHQAPAHNHLGGQTMRTAYTLLALTLLTLPSAPALGQNVLHELHGEVFSMAKGANHVSLVPESGWPLSRPFRSAQVLAHEARPRIGRPRQQGPSFSGH